MGNRNHIYFFWMWCSFVYIFFNHFLSCFKNDLSVWFLKSWLNFLFGYLEVKSLSQNWASCLSCNVNFLKAGIKRDFRITNSLVDRCYHNFPSIMNNETENFAMILKVYICFVIKEKVIYILWRDFHYSVAVMFEKFYVHSIDNLALWRNDGKQNLIRFNIVFVPISEPHSVYFDNLCFAVSVYSFISRSI